MVHVLILAGGTGSRMGRDIPKQYIEVSDKPIISYCIDTFEQNCSVDKIWIAANCDWHDYIHKFVGTKFCGFTAEGATRQHTIKNGLEEILHNAGHADIVIIHDAARPLVSDRIINECSVIPDNFDGIMPVLPMKDTVYLSNDGVEISSLLDRNCVFAGQSPESFRVHKYYDAINSFEDNELIKINGSSEIAVKCGMKIKLIDGDENNFKITTPNDLVRFKEILNESLRS